MSAGFEKIRGNKRSMQKRLRRKRRRLRGCYKGTSRGILMLMERGATVPKI
jgi:hypothetical protein